MFLRSKPISKFNVLLCFFAFVGVAFPDFFLGSLIRSFILQGCLAALLLATVFVLTNRPVHLGLAICSVLLFGSGFASRILPVQPSLEIGNLSIAHFNVFKFNEHYDSVCKAALESNADLISFQETDSEWTDHLKTRLSSAYPYSVCYPLESCCFGLAVFSKHPISNAEILSIEGLPNITGSITINEQPLQFICSHTKAPTSPENFNQRNRHIQTLSQFINTSLPSKRPVLVIGDFNSVPWDTQIMQFKTKTALEDSRSGFQVTFPAWFPPLLIPIDFIFHSSDIQCTAFNTINTHSSDHYGIIGQYLVRKIG